MSVVLFGLFILASAGFYPVAIVGTTPIFAKTWQKAEDAAKNFEIAQARARGAEPVDFSLAENRELLLEVKLGTLTFLIEDAIIRQKGEEAVDGLGTLSRERVIEALRESSDPEGAARAVYGLSFNDFRGLVLMPQARRDVLKEALIEKNQDFDIWLLEAKKEASVRLMFVPFKWSGEEIQ
ncbi:MAG: hypothetical protein HYW91_01760 [Candidatus Sungbacteria bacterium]|nr:hypothetical protein [Candidatus Sungbacteria bacterium]